MQGRLTAVALVALAMACLAYGATVEMESQADLAAAAELALLAEKDNGNVVWHVRVFNTVLPAKNNTGPFSHVGLHPVKPHEDPVVTLQNEQAERKRIREERDAAIKAVKALNSVNTPTGPLTRAKIIEPPAPNPMLPVNDSSLVKPIPADVLRTLKPVTMLGIPDKVKNPEAWKEWKKSQELFGYLGLHPVPTTAARTARLSAAASGKGRKARRAARRLARLSSLAPVKVIGKEYTAGGVPELTATEKAAMTITPVIVPGVVAPPPPPAAPAAPAAPAPAPVNTPNPPMPVPGAKFIELSEAITPMTFEDSEALAKAERQDAWSTLSAGVSDMFHTAVDAHNAASQQVSQMSADLAAAVGAEEGSDAYTLLLSLAETAEEAPQYGEVSAHHEAAAEHEIPKEFKFVRASRVLSSALDTAAKEHSEQVAHMEDKVALVQQSLEEATQQGASAEVEQQARSAANHVPFQPVMSIRDHPFFQPSPYMRYLAAQMRAIAPRPVNANSTWHKIHAYRYNPIQAAGTYIAPHPRVVSVVANGVAEASTRSKSFYRNEGKAVYRLATKVENLLNQLGKATVAERKLVAKALNARAYARKRGNLRRSKGAFKAGNKALTGAKKLANKVSKSLKEVINVKASAKKIAALKKNASPVLKAVVDKAQKAKADAAKAVKKAAKDAKKAATLVAAAKKDPKNAVLAAKAQAAVKKQAADKAAALKAIKASKVASTAAAKIAKDEKKANKAKAALKANPNSKTAKKAAKKAIAKEKKDAKKAIKTMKKQAKKVKAAKKAAKKAVKKAVKKAEKKAVAASAAVVAPTVDARVARLEALVAQLAGKAGIKVDSLKAAVPKKAAKTSKKAEKKAKKAEKKAAKAAVKLAKAKATGDKKAIKKAEKKVKKAEKKAKKAEKKADKKAKAAVKADPAAACANAAKVVAECKAKKEKSPKCARAEKAVASPTCSKAVAKKVAMIASEEAVELLSQEDRETLMSFIELGSSVDEADSDAALLEELQPSPVDNASVEEDAAESEAISGDIAKLAASALTEEVAEARQVVEKASNGADYNLDLGELPTIPTYASSNIAVPEQKQYTVTDTLSQIAQALDEQNA